MSGAPLRQASRCTSDSVCVMHLLHVSALHPHKFQHLVIWAKQQKCLSNQKLPRQSEVSFLIPYNHHTKHLPFTNIVNITFVVFYQKKKKERLRRLQGCSYCVKLQGILFVQRKMRKDLSLPLINNTHFSLASRPRIKNGCVWCSTNQTGT